MPRHFGHSFVNRPGGGTGDSWYPYDCGHCGAHVSGAVVGWIQDDLNREQRWLHCSKCGGPSAQGGDGRVYPGVSFGPRIGGLPPAVDAAFNEARNCLSVDARTACEAVCPKILMHIAVDKGAKEGATFASYIDYLEKQGYVTPPMKEWVKLIKDHGNEANHRIDAPDRKRAEGTLLFTAQLLRTVYEMGHVADQFAAPAKEA